MLSADAESRRFRTLAEARILPVRLTTIPDMTSARQLEPAVTKKVLINTGRDLLHNSGRQGLIQTERYLLRSRSGFGLPDHPRRDDV